ncbi:MAG: hypothetical protein RMJ46_08955 [Bacteroidota bacterium]|nr:hypothetical protein [Bacteroidota bacterium]
MVEAGGFQPAVEPFGDVKGTPGVPALQDGGGHPGHDRHADRDDSFDSLSEAAEETSVGKDGGVRLEILAQLAGKKRLKV